MKKIVNDVMLSKPKTYLSDENIKKPEVKSKTYFLSEDEIKIKKSGGVSLNTTLDREKYKEMHQKYNPKYNNK